MLPPDRLATALPSFTETVTRTARDAARFENRTPAVLSQAGANERQPQRAERAIYMEGAEAFFPLLITRFRSLRIAPEAASFVVARRREACRLAPPQHGGTRSGANDDEEGGSKARDARAASPN